MKKKNILSVASFILCLIMLFASCTKTPVDDEPSGAGGSNIAIESTSKTEAPETTAPPRYSANDKLIALTFDDGPSYSATNKILDILEKNNSTATFFVVGYNIEKNVSTIKRAQNIGCEIGNHSNSHKNLTKCSYNELREQVDKPNELLKSLTGIEPKLFRVPGGNFKNVEEDIGMPLIQWSIDTLDWKYKDASHEDRTEDERNADLKKISDKVIENAEEGDIILMHDIYSFTADLCEIIVPALVEKGFKLVTISEMYEAYGQEFKNGKVYYSIDVIPANAVPIEPGNYMVKTNGGVLNIRAEADFEAESLAKIPNGTPVIVLRSVAGWAYVEYNSVTGWVNSKFLEKK